MKRSLLKLTALILAVSTPSAALETVQQTTIAREHGAVEVVLLFTTVCEPCREAIPTWNRLVLGADALDLDISFRAISGELSQDIELFLEEHPIEGEVLSAPAVDLARAYGLRRLPSIVVVRRGKGVDLIELEAITLDGLQALVAEA